MSGPLLRRTGIRHLRRHPGQVVLSVVGVALGVAVVVSIDLAVQSAREAFRVSTETVAGRATHHLVGGPTGIPDPVFARVHLEAGVAAAPVVEGWAASPLLPGRAIRVLGVDPFSEGPFRPWLAGGGPGVGVAELVATPGAVVLGEAMAGEAGLAPGDSFVVVVGGEVRRAVVAGVLRPVDDLARQGLRDLLIMDIAQAQVFLGQTGSLSRIDLILPSDEGGRAAPSGEGGAAGHGDGGAVGADAPGAVAAGAAGALAAVQAVLPPDVRVEESGARTRTMAGMIRAFDLNLTALSLLAMVFGMFLIYNAMTFSVVLRREQIGTLRALGVTRRETMGQILGEAAALGAVGTALGLGLGIVLGRGLVRLVTRTINDLYFVVSVEGLSLDPGVLLKGAVLGIAATVVAAYPPAREAAHAPPRATQTRSVVEERWRRLVPRAAWAGGALVAAGGALLLAPGGVPTSFAALFAIILGMALLTPLATVAFMRGVRPLAAAVVGVLGTMAARGVVASLSRTAPAVASLMVAVSVTVGLGIMISSFRSTVVRWLDQTLQADVYVAPPSPVASRAEGTLDSDVVRALAGAPGVEGVSTYRALEPTSGRYGAMRLVALDLHPRGEAAFDLARALPDPFRGFRRGGVLVSEPFAWRHDLAPGDSVWLDSPGGERGFPVAGVFLDYGSERGVVMIARETWDRWWDDPAITSLGLFLAGDTDPETALEGLRAAVAAVSGAAPSGGSPGLAGAGSLGLASAGSLGLAATGSTAVVLRSNRELREGSLEVFDRTFAITAVLRMLAFVVAFIGVLSALMALQLERGRELAVLRANGMTPGQLWTLVTAQTGLMGLVAGLLAIPAGLVLAAVMIFVVNKRSFGWTLRMEVGPEIIVQAVALAVVGALLAGVYPAWRMARARPADALRSE